MNTCTICGYKVVSNKIFENHKVTHKVTDPVEAEKVDAIAKEEIPVVPSVADPIQVPASQDIVLRFTKPVEIIINGKQYFGETITLTDMSLATEIVRIARTAYGPTILA